jgi:hypothetical protein
MARPHPLLLPLAAGREPATEVALDEAVVASALEHGMQGLLWSWARGRADGSNELRTRLAGYTLVAQRRHAEFWDTLAHVATVARSVGVEVATIKGVTAEARWYRCAGERPCTDVDVLVAPSSMERVGVLLDALAPGHPLREEIDTLARAGVMQSVNLRVDDVPVDLHFDLLKLGIPTRQRDVVWSRCVEYPLPDGTTMRVLDPELALVHLLLHLNKDSFPRLLGYADIARILERERLDWDFIDRFVRAEGLEVSSYCALDQVVRTLDLVGPVSVPQGLRARVWAMVWPDAVTLLGGAGTDRSRRQDVIPLLARGRSADVVRWLRAIAFPPPSTVALRYRDLPGPYLWRLTRGRLRTALARRHALRARLARPVRESGRPPDATAALLRKAADARPLWLDVHGGSMGRSIRDGTRVRIERATRPRRDEVWAFCDRRGDIVVHRYRGERAGHHQFQGDTRVRGDDPVSDAQLIGRVVEVDPYRSPVRWGALAGGLQRTPRVAVATMVRRWRGRG